jgi:MFS family permease
MSRPSYGWFVIGLWMASTMTGFVILFNIGILMPSIAEDLNLSPGQQGMLGAASSIGNLVLALPLGWWTARFSPKAVIASTLVLGALLIFVQGWSPAFAVLLIGRLGFGVALMAMEPPGAALIAQWFPADRIVFVNSLSNASFGFVMGAGLVATPFILTLLGGEWRTAFYVSGVVYAVLTVAWVLFGRDKHPVKKRRGKDPVAGEAKTPGAFASTSVRDTLMHRDLLLACLGMAGAVMAWAAFISFFPTLMLERYEVSLEWSGGLLAINMGVGGIMGVAMAFLLARSPLLNPVLVVLGLAMTAGYVAMTLTGSLPLLLVYAAVSGLSGAYFPLLYSAAFQLRGVTRDRIPIAVAAVMTAVSVGMVGGPIMTGFLEEAMGELRMPLIIASMAGLILVPVGALISLSPPQADEPGPGPGNSDIGDSAAPAGADAASK